jgi:hypothetical protein
MEGHPDPPYPDPPFPWFAARSGVQFSVRTQFLKLPHRYSLHISFRQIAPFGRGTIRRFTHDVADLKKLAARDFEDILQVIGFIDDFTWRTLTISVLSAVFHALRVCFPPPMTAP